MTSLRLLSLLETRVLDLSYAINDKLSVAANGDYGHDAANSGVSWAGVAGYSRYQILSWVAAAAR